MTATVDRPAPPDRAGGFPALGRAAGAVWFLFLALLYARTMQGATISLATWAPALSRACTIFFFLTLAWLMLARGPALASRSDLPTRLISLTGTYGVWVVAFLPQAPLPPSLSILSAAVTLVGSLLIIVAVAHLGRSFSIGPQARRLVTRGPYAIVRHPLYAAEEIALIGVAMHVIWYAAVPFLLVHVALQLTRMGYEEQVLGRIFPEYEAYALRTARWIPGLW